MNCLLDTKPAASVQETHDGTQFGLCADCTRELERAPLWRPTGIHHTIMARLRYG